MNTPDHMTDFSSGSAAIFIKAYGFKAFLGMLGAAMLYAMLPPVRKDGTFDRNEFVMRLIVAGLFSTMFGDWAVSVLGNFEWLHAKDHTAPIYLIVGAPGWWISRAVALWFNKRRDKDIAEQIKDVKEVI